MPGFSGTPWVVLGTTIADISPNAASYGAIPLSCKFSLDAFPNYADIANLFAEYRVAGVVFTFSSQNGSAGLDNVGGIVPEIWASPWPESDVPPTTIIQQESRVCTRRCVSGFNTLVMPIAPRPAVQMYQSPTTTGYVFMSNQDTWASTASTVSMPWYALTAIIRQFLLTNNSGMNVRISAEAFIECRRPT
jgi:hypothetical protein